MPNTRQDYAFNGDPNPDRIVNLGDMVLGDSRALIINPVGDGIDLGEDYPPPLRLIIKCWAMGYEPWIVPMTINQFERYG